MQRHKYKNLNENCFASVSVVALLVYPPTPFVASHAFNVSYQTSQHKFFEAGKTYQLFAHTLKAIQIWYLICVTACIWTDIKQEHNVVRQSTAHLLQRKTKRGDTMRFQVSKSLLLSVPWRIIHPSKLCRKINERGRVQAQSRIQFSHKNGDFNSPAGPPQSGLFRKECDL